MPGAVLSRWRLWLPADVVEQIEALQDRVRKAGGVPASVPQTALALLREALEKKIAR